MNIRPTPDPVNDGQESVWDYPRPPATRACEKTVRIEFAGKLLAETRSAFCILETSHPPNYYLPPADVDMSMLVPSEGRSSFCEWKGAASYYDVVRDSEIATAAGWCYPNPVERFSEIRNFLCFYAGAMQACYVDDELVIPQPGGFYGGWITSSVAGPFKGTPGTGHW